MENESPPSLAQRIVGISQEVADNPIIKSGKHPTQHYEFASADDVSNVLNTAMRKWGVICIPSIKTFSSYDVTSIKGKDEKATKVVETYVGITFEFVLVNADNAADNFSMFWFEAVQAAKDKGVPAAATSAHKHAMLHLFGITPKRQAGQQQPQGRPQQNQNLSQPKPPSQQQTPTQSTGQATFSRPDGNLRVEMQSAVSIYRDDPGEFVAGLKVLHKQSGELIDAWVRDKPSYARLQDIWENEKHDTTFVVEQKTAKDNTQYWLVNPSSFRDGILF